MKLSVLTALWLLAGVGFAEEAALNKEQAKTSETKGEEKLDKKVPLVILTQAELDEVLQRRMNGGLSYDFKQFANMFFVSSRIGIGYSVALGTADGKIAKTELQPVFPDFYKPTMREILDTIALQTFSKWSYRKEDQFLASAREEKEAQKEIIVVHFEKTPRVKPYEVTLAKGWESEDRGHWTACRPPDVPVGMDIYQSGTYSTKDKAKEPELLERVRKAVALEWAQRVKKGTTEADLKPAKVGAFDALSFNSMIDASSGGQVRWRHWVFMVGNECYFIVSTIFPEDEKALYPDVEAMLKTFRLKKP